MGNACTGKSTKYDDQLQRKKQKPEIANEIANETHNSPFKESLKFDNDGNHEYDARFWQKEFENWKNG